MNRNIVSESISLDAFWTLNKKMVATLGLEQSFLLADLSSKQIFFSERNEDKDGFFFCTTESVEKDCNMSKRTQIRVINDLKASGIIETKRQGMPAKRYVKINYEAIEEIVFSCRRGSVTTSRRGSVTTSRRGSAATYISNNNNKKKKINKKENKGLFEIEANNHNPQSSTKKHERIFKYIFKRIAILNEQNIFKQPRAGTKTEKNLIANIYRHIKSNPTKAFWTEVFDKLEEIVPYIASNEWFKLKFFFRDGKECKVEKLLDGDYHLAHSMNLSSQSSRDSNCRSSESPESRLLSCFPKDGRQYAAFSSLALVVKNNVKKGTEEEAELEKIVKIISLFEEEKSGPFIFKWSGDDYYSRLYPADLTSLIGCGSFEEIYKSHAERYCNGFLGVKNIKVGSDCWNHFEKMVKGLFAQCYKEDFYSWHDISSFSEYLKLHPYMIKDEKIAN